MSGHSKWATIKRKKAVTDSRRSAMFTKIIREITVAAKEGGSNLDGNPRLRLAINTARKASMPKDVIERAVNKGNDPGSNFQEPVYEGIGAGGFALMIETQTDNLNRTVANLRAIFSRADGALGTSGSVAFMFERKGVFQVPVSAIDEDTLTLEVADAGAEDVENDGEFYNVTCPFEAFGAVSAKLDELKVEVESAELQRIPTTTVQVTGENLEKALKLLDKLDEDDDVAKVFHNLEMSEEVVAAMG